MTRNSPRKHLISISWCQKDLNAQAQDRICHRRSWLYESALSVDSLAHISLRLKSKMYARKKGLMRLPLQKVPLKKKTKLTGQVIKTRTIQEWCGLRSFSSSRASLNYAREKNRHSEIHLAHWCSFHKQSAKETPTSKTLLCKFLLQRLGFQRQILKLITTVHQLQRKSSQTTPKSSKRKKAALI